jgi:hypothetical protein
LWAQSPGGRGKYSDNWFSAGGEYKFLFNGNTGTITVECMDEADDLCRGKTNAVGAAVSSLSVTAGQLANPDTPATDIDPLALYNAANNVNTTILATMQSYAKQGQLKNKLQDFQDISKQYGWVIRRFFILINNVDQSGSARGHVFRHCPQPR